MIVGICGRSGSGKSTFATNLMKKLSTSHSVGLIAMDDFYSELTEDDHLKALNNDFDFDCLEAFDIQRMVDTVEAVKGGNDVSYYGYDHANHRHKSNPVKLGRVSILFVEGLYLFAIPDLVSLFDIKIFMDIEADESLLRRIRRDTVYRRRTVEGVLEQYEKYVKPAYESIVAPSRRFADLSVMNGAFNEIAFNAMFNCIFKMMEHKACLD